ncbi:MAG: hypothetical protein GXP45_07595 [bacterium]|nr:hypothetical protein [bacterium]
MHNLQQKLKDIDLDLDLEWGEKGLIFSHYEEPEEIQVLAFLFGLSLSYGKWEIKE